MEMHYFHLTCICREILKLNDGGEVALDWLEDGCAATAPIVIILPGAIGHSQSQYIRCLVLSANHMKFRVVVFNYRGLGGMSLKVIIRIILIKYLFKISYSATPATQLLFM
jgi:predicted alpha/beta-fold hydrolase